MLSDDRKRSVLACQANGVPTGEGSTKKLRTESMERHCALQDVFGQATPQELNDWIDSVGQTERRTIIWVAARVLSADNFLNIVKGTVRAEHEDDIAKALAPVQAERDAAKDVAVENAAIRDTHKRNAERLSDEVAEREDERLEMQQLLGDKNRSIEVHEGRVQELETQLNSSQIDVVELKAKLWDVTEGAQQ